MSSNHWVTALKASKHLGVSEQTLTNWRTAGFLKFGMHWRSSLMAKYLPWVPGIVYQLDLCEQEINDWWGREVRSAAHYRHQHRHLRDRHMDQVVLGPFNKAH